MHPGKAIFHASPNMPTSEIDIKSGPLEDLYVALVNYSPDGEVAAFKIFIGPFTLWFWLGGTILLLGTLICLWPTRDDLEALRLETPPRYDLGRALTVTSLAAMCFVPLGVHLLESRTGWGSALRWERVEATTPRATDPAVEPGAPT
jgi:cytochrome c-type biogenesis protein CcmF